MTTPTIPSGLLSERAVYRSLGEGDRIGAGFWGSPRTYDEGLQRFNGYALVYVLRGGGVHEDAAGTRTPLRAGSVFQRFPQEPHRVVCEAGWEECFLDGGGAMAESLCRLGAQRLPRVLHAGIDLPLIRRIDRLVRDLQTAAPADLLRCCGEVMACVGAILALAQPPPEEDPHHEAIAAACRLLSEGGHAAAFALLARRHGLSAERLRKVFTQRLGCPPMTWARRNRLDRARELLLTSRLGIAGIAARLGWRSAEAFAKRFRAETGLPPGAFRRRDQN